MCLKSPTSLTVLVINTKGNMTEADPNTIRFRKNRIQYWEILDYLLPVI